MIYIYIEIDASNDRILFYSIAFVTAVTAFKRVGEPLTTLIDRVDLHPRLVYGSDYPVPALSEYLLLSSIHSSIHIDSISNLSI